MSNQSSIDGKLSRIKAWYKQQWPLCVFCNHMVGGDAQLAHIIRRSYASSAYTREELQTMKLNTGLAHPKCHRIFDDKPREAILLPRFIEVQYIGYLLDPQWHREQKMLFDFFEFPDFEEISNKHATHLAPLNHHGELLYLPTDI